MSRLARPVIVLSRHAEPEDSFPLVHQLLSVYRRRPRVVMKASLQLDPSVDIVGDRVPNANRLAACLGHEPASPKPTTLQCRGCTGRR